jgi:hypothetical protein
VDDLVVVDTSSGDGSPRFLAGQVPGARVIETDDNVGYAAGMNAGIRAALDQGARLVFLLTGDALVADDAIGRLERALSEHGRAGIAGPRVLARAEPSRVASAGISFSPATGRMRHLGFGRPSQTGKPLPVREVDAVDGCAMLVRAEVFEHIGLFHEDYFFYFEDIDFSVQAARAGFPSIVVGDALAWHHGARSIDIRSPLRHYYASRNQLLAVERALPGGAIQGPLRAAYIVALNLAYAALRSPAPADAALGAVVRGTVDHLRGRRGRF